MPNGPHKWTEHRSLIIITHITGRYLHYVNSIALTQATTQSATLTQMSNESCMLQNIPKQCLCENHKNVTSVLTNASVLDLSDRCNVTAFMGHIDRLCQTGVVLRSQPAHLKVRGPAADACSRYSHDIYVIATRNLQGINVQWNVGGDAPNIYLLYDDPLRLLPCPHRHTKCEAYIKTVSK